MRKVTVLFFAFAIFGLITNAQNLTNKKGFTLLPEAGDIALGFDAVPFFDFMLNAADIMNSYGQTAQHPGYVSGFEQVIVGKYFLEDNLAIRGKIGINTSRAKDVKFFDDPKDVFANPGDPDSWGEVSDVKTDKWHEWIIGGGLEFRRGHNRLQGFYGGELLFGLYGESVKKEYAVKQDAEAVTNGYTNGDETLVAAPRVLSSKSAGEFWVGLRGFVGVEYFFAPKISVGAEFGWGPSFYKYGRSKIEVESWDAVNNVSEIKETEGPTKGSWFGFQVDDGLGSYMSPSAALTLLFHF